ncbi:MAG: TMEM143 family protein [Colwellia sp.]|nr:TMEM143 family protein [Colwellia sp.]MCW8866064.1 TMEM143 family protein [Colwellia sp.]MCW9081236.1 TMEM143 family protein [Colwellia sp.]
MAAERFIPFRKQDIIQMCSQALADEKSALSFKQFCQLLSSVIHYDYHELLESLKNNYAPFDPNADTQQLTNFSLAQREQCQTAFADNFANILNAANFEKITEQDLQDALTEESLFKVRLEVEFDDFEQVVFYRRGESQLSETITSFWGLRKQTINFTNYDRVAVFITFKDKDYFEQKKQQPIGFEPSSTIVKLFQNVPKADLEMLFPNSEVRMRPIDKVIIGASAVVGGAVVLVTKLGASILLLAALFAFWLGWRSETVAMTQQHLISFALGMGVFGGFIFKEWSKFKNRKIKFMKALSDNLYFKNLDNNAGVFHTLIDAAEEEDFKEALLAYTFLLNATAGLSSAELDKQIETWFSEQYHCQLDFEISDALSKLEKMNLVSLNNGRYQAVSLTQAKQRLDQRWDSIFNYNQ